MQHINSRHLATLSLTAPGIGLSVMLAAAPASAATYEVGPGKPYTSLHAVAPLLAAGDVVEVEGDAAYAGDVFFKRSGSEHAKITIRGVRVNGRRPVLSGGTNTVIFGGNHYVFEGFDVTGGASRCVFHKAHDVTIRDTVVHDCAGHGILGADSESGSLTLEYVEVYGCGSGDTRHQIYIATDEETRLGSVFRMQHCYVHDGNGGNNVKSRAERNEIYYNWIEGATYHELELIGPDGQDEGLAREDSDVVGNVFRKTSTSFVARVGGDGTGQTFGRFRFVNNTFLLAPGSNAAVRMFDGIESVELSNNVFYRVGGGPVDVYVDRSASWATGAAVIAGANNWVPAGSTAIPAAWTGTLVGHDPGFTDIGALDLRPAQDSPLVDAGTDATASPSGHPFPRPLDAPFYTPARGERAPFDAPARPAAGVIDIGAYELGSDPAEFEGADTPEGSAGDGAPLEGTDEEACPAAEASADQAAEAADGADAAGAAADAPGPSACGAHGGEITGGSCSLGAAPAGGTSPWGGAGIAGAAALAAAALRRRARHNEA